MCTRNQRRAMLELCMFAEASEYQEEIIAVSPFGKITCRVPGPSRFWPEDIMGPQPTAELVIEHREPRRRERLDVPVDPVLLQAGDHNGSTFYQHEKFLAVVRGTGAVEVTLTDGINAALIAGNPSGKPSLRQTAIALRARLSSSAMSPPSRPLGESLPSTRFASVTVAAAPPRP
jgi:hypothetical protein